MSEGMYFTKEMIERADELEKQNEELINYLIIELRYRRTNFGMESVREMYACEYLEKIKQKPIKEILEGE